MFLPTRSTRRRGNVLIVTMLLLALFAIVAVTMVYYATGVAERARLINKSQDGPGSEFPDDGKAALNAFAGSLLFGVNETDYTNPSNTYNSLRGHGLAGNMYGDQYGASVPWNGIGLFSETAATAAIPRSQMINYRFHAGTGVIYDRERTGERAPNAAQTGYIVGRNAPYTYPDNNNAYLAVLVPGTGRVLVPSFVRPGFGPLDPSNPNWTSAAGRYLTVRPRPQEHPQFPRVPQNADGTISGDVKNMEGAPGGNDSIWMDIGAPIILLADGRRVKPMVAPLIVDLDSRLSHSVHGNRMLPAPGPPPPDNFVHASGHGLGPWEVNLQRVLPNSEARWVVGARGAAQTRGGVLTKAFARLPAGQALPSHSPIAWGGYGAPATLAMQYPHPTNIYAGQPNFTNGYDATNSLPVNTNHPSLFNPFEWPTTGPTGVGAPPRSFALSDTKILSSGFARPPSFYLGLEVASLGQTSSNIRPTGGAFSVPNPNPPLATTPNAYRIDSNHGNRHLFTTTPNFSHDVPGLMPNYLSQTGGMGGTALLRDPTTGQLVNPAALLPFPTPQAPGAVSDFGQWQNVRAALGAIDLNRALADYRDLNLPINNPTPQPLGPATVSAVSDLAARLDRQHFARDIFARLVIATGAQATVDNTGNVTIVAAAGTVEFNAIRALAQIAANIVDFIDADDVSTPFVFNPLIPADPQNAANFAPTAPDVIGNHVVFGVEKPRLVLNEAYAEVCNNPMDTMGMGNASNPAQVRFWFELQNPTGALVGSPLPLGNGSAYLTYTAAEGAATPFSPYRVEIVQNVKGGGNVSSLLRNPADAGNVVNVKGDIGVVPDLRFDFVNATAAQRVVAPANGVPGGGMMVCTAAPLAQSGAQEFNPTIAGAINGAAIGAPDSLTYETPLAGALAGTTLAANLKNHVVVLRRLTNPYLPESATNPYVTVDFIDNVPTFDAILRANGTNTDRSAKSWAGMMVNPGYDPITLPTMGADVIVRRHSVGKVQPYAGHGVPTPPQANQEYWSFSFPNSLVLAQVLVDAANAPIDGYRHTLGRQNSRMLTPPGAATYFPGAAPTDARLASGAFPETLMAPYDWLVHLDRPLINQLELLHVTAGKPHELTMQFIVPNTLASGTGKDVVKNAGTVQWLPTVAPHPYANPNPNGLLRALDLLRIQPHGNLSPFAGRTPGKININTIQDKRVWDAVFDSQQNGQNFTQAQVNAMWTAMMTSRSPNGGTGLVAQLAADGNQLLDAASPRNLQSTPIPGASIYDMNVSASPGGIPYDRPFLPFGAPQLAPGSTFALGGAAGIDDTILRRTPGTNVPMLWVPQTTSPLHPYQQAEAAQKVFNNFTTVSNNFAVFLTVGYFEVVGTIPSGFPGVVPDDAQLGREYYREVPGDTRHKFFFIVDRSQIALDAASVLAGAPTIASTTPYQTTVEAYAATGNNTMTIYAPGGNAYAGNNPVAVGGVLAVGTGADREFVTVQTITAQANGLSLLTFAAPLTRDHAIGTCVSNVVPGNPGPQPGFDLADPRYAPIVPHSSRVQ